MSPKITNCMDFLKKVWSLIRHLAVAIQSILSLMNLLLWGLILYVGYRIYQDPLLIYQLPVIIVKAVSGAV